MDNNIVLYQKAFRETVRKMKSEKDILAIMVFGSMVTGDLWEESDIDFFAIIDNNESEIKKIYGEEIGVPIHIRFISKDTFLKIYDEKLKGGYIHRIL